VSTGHALWEKKYRSTVTKIGAREALSTRSRKVGNRGGNETFLKPQCRRSDDVCPNLRWSS